MHRSGTKQSSPSQKSEFAPLDSITSLPRFVIQVIALEYSSGYRAVVVIVLVAS